MQQENHTKEYSIAVILHAVEKAKFDGGREKDIAELLGVDPSNIPKYKDGSSKLSPTNIKILIEKFGPPKMAKGRYLKACLMGTVSEYITTFEKRVNHHFIRELQSLFSYPPLLELLTDATTDKVLSTNTSDEVNEDERLFRFRSSGCENRNRLAVINWITHRVRASAFLQWISEYEDAASSVNKVSHINNLPNLKNFDSEWKDTFVSEEEQPLLYLFGCFIKAIGEKTETFSEALQNYKPEAKQEVVVTGEALLKLDASKQTKYTPRAANVFNQVTRLISYHRNAYDLSCSDLVTQLESIRNFSLCSAEIILQMNEQMMYRILVEENWGKYKSITVIKDVRQDLVIEQFNQLAEFFGLPREHQNTLKSAIASRGGYIPGATVL